MRSEIVRLKLFWREPLLIKKIEEALKIEPQLYNLRTTTRLQTGNLVQFAKSEIQYFGANYTACRVVDRSQLNSWDNTHIEIHKNGVHIESLKNGEDPRFFLWNGELLLYFQVYSASDNDCTLYVKKFSDGEITAYDYPNRLGVNGKNWGLFEANKNLYALYSCEPLQCFDLSSGNIGEEIFREGDTINIWGDDLLNSFGSHRCGAMPIYDATRDTRVVLTHITLSGRKKPFHQLGVLFFNGDFSGIQRTDISSYTEGLLIDPYLAQISDGKIVIQFSAVLGELHKPDSLVQNFELTMQLNDFYRLFL
jgi:hypothetical protein